MDTCRKTARKTKKKNIISVFISFGIIRVTSIKCWGLLHFRKFNGSCAATVDVDIPLLSVHYLPFRCSALLLDQRINCSVSRFNTLCTSFNERHLCKWKNMRPRAGLQLCAESVNRKNFDSSGFRIVLRSIICWKMVEDCWPELISKRILCKNRKLYISRYISLCKNHIMNMIISMFFRRFVINLKIYEKNGQKKYFENIFMHSRFRCT